MTKSLCLRKKILFTIISLFGIFIIYSRKIEPNLLKIKYLELHNTALKKNCTAVLMSDLHLPLNHFIENKLIKALEKIKPDIILIPGDLSSYWTTAEYSKNKINMLSKYGKILMVPGNSDGCKSRQCLYCYMKYPADHLNQLHADILRNDTISLQEYGIKIFGLDDPVTNHDNMKCIESTDSSYYNILLVHSVYKLTEDQKKKFNLICSGHTHGGQIFFLKPFLHAFDPAIDQRYIGGIYNISKTIMIVTTGIGNSFLPIRFGVPPEIMVLKLKTISNSASNVMPPT